MMRRSRSLSPRRHDPDHSLVHWPLTWHGGDPLGYAIHSRGPLDVVVLDGELDIATAPDLGQRLEPLAGAGRHLLLDLTDLRFCDAAGLRLFLRLHKQATAAGGSLHLAAPGRPVSRVISVARLSDVVPVSASVAEVMATLEEVAERERPPLSEVLMSV
jgi:anti-sigma B factor antagonist